MPRPSLLQTVSAAFVVLVLAPQASALTITMGETAILGSSDSGDKNRLTAQKTTLAQAAVLQSLSFYVTTAGGQLRLAVYDATGPGGGPGVKRAETAAFTPVTGWNTRPVTATVSLPAGSYWLAYLPSSSSLTFRRQSSGSARTYGYTFGTMPATFSTSASSSGSHWSFYATLSVPAPTLSLSASAASVSAGQSFTLEWSSTGATGCAATGGWTGAQALSGELMVLAAATKTYTLTCTGAGGSVARAVTVAVSGGTAQLTLVWTDHSDGTAGFTIERKVGAAGQYDQIGMTEEGVTSYMDRTTARGTTYCYRVRAVNVHGYSGYSNHVCAAPGGS
jgi:hypothetical protein